jgi:hypothetical protein
MYFFGIDIPEIRNQDHRINKPKSDTFSPPGILDNSENPHIALLFLFL